MNRRFLHIACWFLLVQGTITPSPVLAGQEIRVGYTHESWDSNFLVHGLENIIPVSYLFLTPNGRFSLRAETAFLSGRYNQEAFPGGTSYNFRKDGFRDSSLGGSLRFPLGSMESILSLGLNLPSGNEKWEIQQNPGNLPLAYISSRFRGRGFGGNALYGMSRTTSTWSLGGAFGYVLSGSTQSGFTAGELDLGDSFLGILTLARKVGSKSSLKLKFSRTFPQPSKIGGQAAFTSAPSLSTLARFEKNTGTTHWALECSATFFGKGKVPGLNGALQYEQQASLGHRLELHPNLVNEIGKTIRLESGLRLKHILANRYDQAGPSFDGGGDLLGVEQTLRLKLGSSVFLDYQWLYQFIRRNKAALDAQLNLVSVDYQRVSFGSSVGFQW